LLLYIKQCDSLGILVSLKKVKKFLKKRLTVCGVLVINIPHQRMRRKNENAGSSFEIAENDLKTVVRSRNSKLRLRS
jgi:hypothetical protein